LIAGVLSHSLEQLRQLEKPLDGKYSNAGEEVC
jgi:hypothetical protein